MALGSAANPSYPKDQDGHPKVEVAAIKILLIEDDPRLGPRLANHLREAGFVVDHCASGLEGRHLGQSFAYDAVILDLGLPDVRGLDVLRAWRAARVALPVLILTARSAWTEKVEGLNAGADDYLAKPFEAAELIARLHALIRRSAGRPEPVLVRGDIAFNPDEGVVRVAGEPQDLTAQERRILTYLMQRPGRIVPEADIADHIYSADADRQSNSVQVYIGRLRRKLGKDRITTHRGMGYRLE